MPHHSYDHWSFGVLQQTQHIGGLHQHNASPVDVRDNIANAQLAQCIKLPRIALVVDIVEALNVVDCGGVRFVASFNANLDAQTPLFLKVH